MATRRSRSRGRRGARAKNDNGNSPFALLDKPLQPRGLSLPMSNHDRRPMLPRSTSSISDALSRPVATSKWDLTPKMASLRRGAEKKRGQGFQNASPRFNNPNTNSIKALGAPLPTLSRGLSSVTAAARTASIFADLPTIDTPPPPLPDLAKRRSPTFSRLESKPPYCEEAENIPPESLRKGPTLTKSQPVISNIQRPSPTYTLAKSQAMFSIEAQPADSLLPALKERLQRDWHTLEKVSMQRQIKRLKSELEEKSKKLESEKTTGTAVEEKNRELQQAVQKTTDLIAKSRKEINRLSQALAEEKQKALAADDNHAKERCCIEALESDIDYKGQRMEALKTEVETFSTENRSLQRRIQGLLAEAEQKRRRYQTETKEQQEALQRAEVARNELQGDMFRLKERLSEKTKMVEDLRTKWEQQNARFLEMRGQQEQIGKVQELQEMVRLERQKADKIMSDYTAQLSTIENKEKELSRAKSEISRLESMLTVAHGEIERLKMGENAIGRMKLHTEHKMTEVQAQLAVERSRREQLSRRLREEKAEMAEENNALHEQVKEKERELQNAKLQVCDLEKRLTEIQCCDSVQKFEQRQMQQDLSQTLQTMATRLQERDNTNARLKEENARLQKELATQLREAQGMASALVEQQVLQGRCKNLEELLHEKDREISSEKLKLLRTETELVHEQLPKPHLPRACTEVGGRPGRDPQPPAAEPDRRAKSEGALLGSPVDLDVVMTSRQADQLGHAQGDLEAVAELVHNAVNNKEPRHELLAGAEEDSGVVKLPPEMLDPEQIKSFKNGLGSLRQDVLRLRKYITKFVVKDMSDQCYIQ